MLQTIRSSNPAPAASSSMVRIMTALAVFAAILFSGSTTVLADPLDGPRAAGIVGERYDGYAEIRQSNAPADVVALVRSINRQRKEYYQQLAQKESVSPAEVGKLYANKIYQSAPNGYWFLTQSGQWQRKF